MIHTLETLRDRVVYLKKELDAHQETIDRLQANINSRRALLSSIRMQIADIQHSIDTLLAITEDQAPEPPNKHLEGD